jgi:hypothetical protein
MTRRMPEIKPRSKLRLAALPFKVLWTMFVIAIPLLGVWVVSSLTSFANGPVWLAVLAGLLLFPILPLSWDAWALARHRRKTPNKPPKLRAGARIILRTLALNLVVLASVVAALPDKVFTALSTRGDWMLESRSSPWADDARSVLFFAADRLEWAYVAARENRFEEVVEQQPEPTPVPVPVPVQVETSTRTNVEPSPSPSPQPKEEPSPQPKEEPPPQPAPVETALAVRWPLEAKLHPLVAEIPPSAETDPDAVAKFFLERENDPLQRLKAIHDYVADRIAYDTEAYFSGKYPPFDPPTVLRTRKAVCAGYAALFQALATKAGYEVATVVGASRGGIGTDDVDGSDHAWNAVKLSDQWYLVDVTWDSGSLASDKTFKKQYGTEYFLTPPEIFGLTHYPAKPKWQLLDTPISRGDFIRQPSLRPEFFAKKLRLISPARSQVSVDKSDVEIVIDNPTDQSLLASFNPKDAGAANGTRCKIEYTLKEAHVICRLPASGTYNVALFAAEDPLAAHGFVGEVEVLARL